MVSSLVRGIVHSIHTHIDDHAALLDHVRLHQIRNAHSGNNDIRLLQMLLQIRSARMADRHGSVAVQQQHGNGNADDVAALRKALNNIGENSLAIVAGSGTPWSSETWGNADCVVMRQVFADELGLRDPDLAVDDMSLAFPVNNLDDLNRGMKEGVIFGVDGTVDLSEAMDQIADRLNGFFAALPETGSAGNGHVSFDYDYVVSVSVVNKAVSTIDWSSASANFIAVTVTRTVTAD